MTQFSEPKSPSRMNVMGPLPVQPPKPRVVKLGDTWVLDTGHADVLHDSWADAMRHAERICGDYVRRLLLWAAMNRSTDSGPWRP